MPFRIAVVGLMAWAFVTFFVAMSGVIDRWPMSLATLTYEAGTSWLMILLYLFLVFVCLDVLRLCHVVPSAVLHSNGWLSGGIAVALTVLFTLAYFHYNDKKRVEMVVTTKKNMKKDVKLVFVSDLHLGYHNTRADLHRWLTLLKAEHPDAILIGGDLIDGSYRPVAQEHMAEEFRSLDIPVIACLGNHDYYTGLNADLQFCRDAGIMVLRDKTVNINEIGNITVIGRDDRTNRQRKSLSEVMRGGRQVPFSHRAQPSALSFGRSRKQWS